MWCINFPAIFKVDFDGLVAASEVEVRKREERERRNKALLEQRLRDVKTEYRGGQSYWVGGVIGRARSLGEWLA